MQQRTDIIPIGGLNTDDDPRHFEQGDYLNAENVVIQSPQTQGDEGLVKTMKSTTSYQLPEIGGDDEDWEYLDVVVDYENDRAYILAIIEDRAAGYFFTIYKHDISTGTVKIIFAQDASAWGILRVSNRDQKYWYNSRIVDDKLIWTDNLNDIRMMDVARMETTYDAGITSKVIIWDDRVAQETGYAAGTLCYFGDRVFEVLQNTLGTSDIPQNLPLYYDDIAAVIDVYLDPVDPNNFTLAALPPLISPTCEYFPDATRNVNQLKGRTWQFSYQYVYLDFRKSTFAPPSLVPAPDKEEDIDGNPETDPTHNNSIRIQINTGSEEVRYIRVVARNSDDPSTWFVVDEIYCVDNLDNRNIKEESIYTVSFYNDKAGEVLEQTEVFNLFNFVPIRAKHMELIEGNRLAFGNIAEGYGRVGHDVSVDLAWEDLAGISTQVRQLYYTFEDMTDQIKPAFVDWQIRFYLPTTNYGAATYYLTINFGLGGGDEEVSYVYNGTDPYPSTVRNGLIAAMNAEWPSEVVPCFNGGSGAYDWCAFAREQYYLAQEPYNNWTFSWRSVSTVVSDVFKYRQLKTGANHSWAIIYRDIVGRITGPVGSGQITKYIPFPTESTSSNVGRRPEISFNINHVPPPQAKTYEIIYAGNKSTRYHLHLLGCNFYYGKNERNDPGSTGGFSSTYYRLRVSRIQTLTRNNLHNWSVEEYVWEKGDRIRVIGKVNASGVLTEINDNTYDVEIAAVYVDQDYAQNIGDGNIGDNTVIEDEWLYFPVKSIITPTAGSPPNAYPDNLLVEIYRPFVAETNVFFTTGMTFEIGTDVYGNKFHKGDTDQVLDSQGFPDTPAIVNNTSHDSWKYLRNFRNIDDDDNFALWIESEYASDFYIAQKLTSQGNPVPDVQSSQQNVLTKRLRHGGKINIGSQLNQIAEFEFDDFLDLKDEHGPIEGLRLVGFVLKAIQHTKVTSIYISRQESFTASGESQYLFTDNVFGSARPAMENWGTSHPGSVVVYNRHLYFWDNREAVVVRDAANGMVAISDYKMKRYFHGISNSLSAVSAKEQYVQFTYCVDYNQLWCSFGTATGTQEVISFSEEDQRWKAKFQVTNNIGRFYWRGHRIWFINRGFLYEFLKGTDYLNIAGAVRTGKLEFVVAPDPAKPQTYEALIVYQKPIKPVFSEVSVPDRATGVGDGPMTTIIHPVNIEEREGVYYCQIMRDRNTPGPGTQDAKEMNGRKMRGLYLKVDMEITETTDPVELSNIIAISTPSERSK
jgi:hypothetical protein